MEYENHNFGNEPISMAEIKSAKERSSTVWKPRDVLVSMLQDIDRCRLSCCYVF